MTDVNLNSPDLKLVANNERSMARASVAPQANSGQASARVTSSVSNHPRIVLHEGVRTDIRQVYQEVEREELDSAVTRLNDFVQSVRRDLQFEVDNESGKTIVRVLDRETKELIRQIPDEVALRLAENLQQDEPLTLFNIRV